MHVAEQKMEKELKERDDKYLELETKLQRLLKRAKQRIQDIQKVTSNQYFVCPISTLA
jgi:molecular chaperone GrpE (heat shock protein)